MDEKTGEYVTAYMREDSSPAIDKGNPARPSAAESASGYAGNGRRVNIGAYGGTPWATMSKGGGSVYYIR